MNRGNSTSTERGRWQSRGRGGWQPRARGGRGYHNGRGWSGGGRGGGGSWNGGGRGGRRGAYGTPSSSPRPGASQSQFHGTENTITNMFSVVPGPYRGWKLYLLQEAYKERSPTVCKVQASEGFLRRNSNLYELSEVEERRAFTVDLKRLKDDPEFKSEWPTFETDIIDHPEHTINCLGLAMHQIVVTGMEDEVRLGLEGEPSVNVALPAIELPAVRARVMNLEPVLQLKNLKANYFGKLVCVRGTIIRVGNIKLLCTWMAFECAACGGVQCCKQAEGVHVLPSSCGTERCRGRTFTPLHRSPFTQTVNWQSIRLQEISSDDQREGGRVPRTVECELTEDLLDSCMPGDVITVTGIVKVRNSEEANKKRAPSMFLMYIEAVSVVNSKCQAAAGGSGVEFNTKDYYAIQEIHGEPALFALLVNSLCPLIYGHEMVKAGLLLTLLGGSRHQADARSDPHILVVGDPGLGKSQMLQACASVAPRGVYVCGNTSTAAGLTVTLTRESGGNYALEAGALVLADQGCCCIDEFDKMSNQHQALLEAMEQQSISIAKAGIICSLPARTSIMAAANPVGGHYNRAKTVAENLRMGSPLLSRFDLVFILLDKPNEVLDGLLTDHVMALHSGVKHKPTSSASVSSSFVLDPNNGDSRLALIERLRPLAGEPVDPIPHQLLRKYIAYARKYVQPRLTPAAAAVLQHFYLELRRQHQTMDCTPITTRQLKSMVRLTEARAKLELREEANEADAIDVVEIMRYSLIDTLSDGFGGIDFNRSQMGSGMSSRNQAKKFMSAMQRRADTQCRSVFSVSEMKEVGQMAGVQVSDFSSFLATLNTQGFLLKKGANLYQLLSVDY